MKRNKHSNTVIGRIEKFCGVCSTSLDLSRQVCPNCQLSVCPKCIKKSVFNQLKEKKENICDNCYPQVFKQNVRSKFEGQFIKEYSELNELNDNLKKEQFKTYEQTVRENKLQQELEEMLAKQKTEERDLLVDINNAEMASKKLNLYLRKKDKQTEDLLHKQETLRCDKDLLNKTIDEIQVLLECEENKMLQLESMLENERNEYNRVKNQLQFAEEIKQSSNKEIKAKIKTIQNDMNKVNKGNLKIKQKIDKEQKKSMVENNRKWETVIQKQSEEIERLKSSIATRGSN